MTKKSRSTKTYIGGILLCTLLLRALPDLSKEKPLKHIMKMILCLHSDVVGWSAGMLRHKTEFDIWLRKFEGYAYLTMKRFQHFRGFLSQHFRKVSSLYLQLSKTTLNIFLFTKIMLTTVAVVDSFFDQCTRSSVGCST